MAARHFFVQSDKETKQRKRFNRSTLSVHSVQFQFMGAPKARCSAERRMCEPLLLANPDMNTLRHQCSRASTHAEEPALHHGYLLLHFLVGWLRELHGYFRNYGLVHFCGFVSRWVIYVVRDPYKFGGGLFADSAGCSLGRFNHWWRSVWVSVFGEAGVRAATHSG